MMRFTACFITTFLAWSTLGAELTVKISNVEEATGRIFVAVWDNKDAWPDGQPLEGIDVEALTPETEVTFELPEGTYAVSVFHDVNGNGEMDYNALRMPKEPWGTSNDVPARFGPPKYDKMTLELDSDGATAEVTLKR